LRAANHRHHRTVGVSPSLPVVSGAQVVKALGKIGFEQVAIVAVTSRCIVELARGTLGSILRQAQLSTEEFQQLM
ncbi:MAG TPA: hypothetical protein VFA00_01845, partial [Actinomycetota bacterium]|nr:hypothetical protein [Actinomycetota bacterium]